MDGFDRREPRESVGPRRHAGASPEWQRPRFWLLIASALVLVCVVEYKEHHAGRVAANARRVPKWPAQYFDFEALDSENRLVKFRRYLGRHQILLAFFAGRRGIEGCPEVLSLRNAFPELKRRGAVVVAVTDAIPQENRAAFDRVGPFPFPIVSDPTLDVQRRWHCLEKVRANGCVVFYIDRAGRVRVDEKGRPVPQPTLDAALRRILGPTPTPAR